MQITAQMATALAKRVTATMTWDEVRDMIDLHTDGELSPWQLDTLTDWVRKAYDLVHSFQVLARTPAEIRWQTAEIIPFPREDR